MRKITVVGFAFLLVIYFTSAALAITAQDLSNQELYIAVPKIYNIDSYIKKGTIVIGKQQDNRVVNFIHLEDQGNAVCEYESQFIYDDAKSELRLKRTSMKRYNQDGSLGMNVKMSTDFNISNDSSGFEAYTALVTGKITNTGVAAAPEKTSRSKNHNILGDNTVKEKWAIADGISYNDIYESGYNKVYAPISTPFLLTDDYRRLAAIDARPDTIRSYVVRGTPRMQRLSNGDVKIYFQWVQCDESLPVLLVNACFYFEDDTQTLFRYDPEVHVLDNATGKRLQTIAQGEESRQECSPKTSSYGDFEKMKAGKFAAN